MSAIAEFRLIETSKLNDLRDHAEIKIEKKLFGKKTIDNYWDYLNSNSKKLKDFGYSGYIFTNLLIFLAENKGIDLLKSKYDDIANSIVERRKNSTIILTYEQRQAYLEKLDADKFTTEELIAFNKDFSEDDEPELAKAEIEGIKALRDGLSQLTGDNQVVLLSMEI
jgi:hypothetical protein